jgi:hypothetical protein
LSGSAGADGALSAPAATATSCGSTSPARGRRLTFLSPFDPRGLQCARPHAWVRPQSALARLAHLISRADDARVPSAAVAAEIDLLPHQLEPAMAMLGGCGRILIADEVGLGKTIQAGLAMAELVRVQGSPRILVLARPRSGNNGRTNSAGGSG